MSSFADKLRKREAVNAAERAGRIADSLEIRKAIMARVYTGEITFEDAQSELAKIKRNAKKNGLLTRAKVFRGA